MTTTRRCLQVTFGLIAGCVLCRAAPGQSVIQSLDAFENQRRDWQTLRSDREGQLREKLRESEKARSDADAEGAHEKYVEGMHETLEGYDKSMADAFKAAVTGEGLLEAGADGSDRAIKLLKASDAGSLGIQRKVDREKNEKKVDDLAKDTAAIQREISASNQALTAIAINMNQILGAKAPPQLVIAWFRQLDKAMRDAKDRQEQRKQKQRHEGEGSNHPPGSGAVEHRSSSSSSSGSTTTGGQEHNGTGLSNGCCTQH